MPSYVCDICEANPADFLVGVLMNGDQIALGTCCVTKWARAIDKALKEARTAEQNAGIAAQEPATPDEAEWEANYPQGRDEGAEAAAEAATEVPGSDTETAPAPVE